MHALSCVLPVSAPRARVCPPVPHPGPELFDARFVAQVDKSVDVTRTFMGYLQTVKNLYGSASNAWTDNAALGQTTQYQGASQIAAINSDVSQVQSTVSFYNVDTSDVNNILDDIHQ